MAGDNNLLADPVEVLIFNSHKMEIWKSVLQLPLRSAHFADSGGLGFGTVVADESAPAVKQRFDAEGIGFVFPALRFT